MPPVTKQWSWLVTNDKSSGREGWKTIIRRPTNQWSLLSSCSVLVHRWTAAVCYGNTPFERNNNYSSAHQSLLVASPINNYYSHKVEANLNGILNSTAVFANKHNLASVEYIPALVANYCNTIQNGEIAKQLDLVYQNSAIIRMAAEVFYVIMLVYARNMGWLGSSWYKWEIRAYFSDKQREPVTSHHLSGHTSPSFSSSTTTPPSALFV